MARNLGTTQCRQCPAEGPIVLVETPHKGVRLDGIEVVGWEEKVFADARCDTCAAQYIAWVNGETVYDLSYRSTFNDEPGSPTDLAQFVVEKHFVVRRKIKWCRHGRRQMHEGIDVCQKCSAIASMYDNMEAYSIQHFVKGRWKVHINSPLAIKISDDSLYKAIQYLQSSDDDTRIAKVKEATLDPLPVRELEPKPTAADVTGAGKRMIRDLLAKMSSDELAMCLGRKSSISTTIQDTHCHGEFCGCSCRCEGCSKERV